jgi:CO/xanthine dehydrogenase Mo-binding subunit
MKNGSPVVEKVYAAIDCGVVINPDAAANLAEGGSVDGIGTRYVFANHLYRRKTGSE